MIQLKLKKNIAKEEIIKKRTYQNVINKKKKKLNTYFTILPIKNHNLPTKPTLVKIFTLIIIVLSFKGI